jgi:hypothetical protein
MRTGPWILASVGVLAACGEQSGASSSGRGAADASVPLSVRSYQRVCANCHLETGKGMAPAYRSLVGSAWATGSVDRVVAIVLYGVQGPVKDASVTYYTAMLPYGSGATMRDEWRPSRGRFFVVRENPTETLPVSGDRCRYSPALSDFPPPLPNILTIYVERTL